MVNPNRNNITRITSSGCVIIIDLAPLAKANLLTPSNKYDATFCNLSVRKTLSTRPQMPIAKQVVESMDESHV